MNDNARKVLEFVAKFIRENKYSPSLREIAEAVGLSHKNVGTHLDSLEAENLITKAPYKARSITLTPEYEQQNKG